SATLLILRATQILSFEGRSAASAAATAVLLYTAHNAANAFAAYPAGALADRIGRRVVLVMGVALFALACVAFAFSPSSLPILAALFVAIGPQPRWSRPRRGATPPRSSRSRCVAGDTGSSGSSTG